MTRAASAFAVALLLALPDRASAVDVKTVLAALGFPDDTEAKVQADQFVEVALPTRSDRDLNVGIAFLVRQTPDQLVANVMKEKPLLRADPNMIAYGDFHGDGTLGWAEHAPYHAIVVTAGAPHVPRPLLEQLTVGGRLVIPVGPHPSLQMLVRVRRLADDSYKTEELCGVRFVPLIGAAGWHA